MIPIVDVSSFALPPHARDHDAATRAAASLRAACEDAGFFYATGHGIDEALTARLAAVTRAFFALPAADKTAVAMEHGGHAWRGWFPLGGELTSGAPDRKEGIYFGAELPASDPRPFHGANLFPSSLPELRDVVLAWMAAMEQLGQSVMRGIAISLDLPETAEASK